MSLPDLSPADAARLKASARSVPFASLRVIVALMLREMTSTYGGKPGGYIWALLEPIAGIALLTFIFSFLRSPPLGSSFAMFYATGMLPFTMLMQLSGRVASSLTYSRALLTYPRVTVLDALLARLLLNVITQVLTIYVVIGAIRMVEDTGTTLILPRILLAMAMAVAFATGLGLFNAVLLIASPMWRTLWGLITRPLALVSGVIFLIEGLPRSWQEWLAWNPIVHVVAEFRAGFYYGYHPDYVSAAYVFGVSLVLMAVGLALVVRFHRDVLEG